MGFPWRPAWYREGLDRTQTQCRESGALGLLGDSGGLGGEGRPLGGGRALVVQIKALHLNRCPEWSLNGKRVGRIHVTRWTKKMGRD